jgi:hypothetical protein
MKSRAVNGLSIAFEVSQAICDGEVRHLVKLRMREVISVTFPMNEPAYSGGDQGQHLDAITGGPEILVRHQPSCICITRVCLR